MPGEIVRIETQSDSISVTPAVYCLEEVQLDGVKLITDPELEDEPGKGYVFNTPELMLLNLGRIMSTLRSHDYEPVRQEIVHTPRQPKTKTSWLGRLTHS